MAELSFDEYKSRISIQEVLADAGYHFYRRDGLRWPCYYRLDDEGRRIHGDKFIVCANGMACFQPPQMRKYNVISFIAEHPDFFPEGRVGKDPYTVVNEVCSRLLGQPLEERQRPILEPRKESNPFLLCDYQIDGWKGNDWESQKKFFPFFKPRGITRETQRVFCGSFFLSTLKGKDGSRQNLSFAMRIPGSDKIVGLEQRGLPDANGNHSYKGMAKGTNATEGVWLANPDYGRKASTNLDKVKDVYWFESAFDAMAFYQLRTVPLRQQIDYLNASERSDPSRYDSMKYLQSELGKYHSALYVSTGGSPSIRQLSGVLSKTPTENQHVCFDNDRAGHVFAVDLLIARSAKDFQTSLLENGQLQVIDQSDEKGKKYTLNLEPFEFDRIAHVLEVGNPDMKDYVDSLRDERNIKSGDFELLPSNSLVSSYYRKIYALEEQYHSGELFQGVAPEERQEVIDRYRAIMKELRNVFDETLKADLEAYRKGRGTISLEEPPVGYKDWNEVTMDKRLYDEQDTISAMGEDGEVITAEVNQDHEENVKRDEDEEETAKRHLRR